MQDFFFVGILCSIALGVFLFRTILFLIHYYNLETSNKIIQHNLSRNRIDSHQIQQMQNSMNSIETVINWKTEDPVLSEDMRQQFWMKTKTRKTPTCDRVSPKERVPLATTDFNDSHNGDSDPSLPIYTYDPSTGGTQV